MRGGHRNLPRYWVAVLWPRSTISILDMKRMLSKMDRSPTLGDRNSHVRFGSKADICSAQAHVRFTPDSGHVQCTSECRLWANSGLMHRSKKSGRAAPVISFVYLSAKCLFNEFYG